MSDSAAAKGSSAQAPPATEKVEEKFAGLHFDNEDDEGPQEPLVEFEEGEDEDGVADEEDAEQDERQPVKGDDDDDEEVPITQFGKKSYKDTIQVGRKARKPIEEGTDPGQHKVQFS